MEEMKELDKNLDKKLHWGEYLKAHFEINEDDIKDFRYKDNKENQELMKVGEKMFLRALWSSGKVYQLLVFDLVSFQIERS